MIQNKKKRASINFIEKIVVYLDTSWNKFVSTGTNLFWKLLELLEQIQSETFYSSRINLPHFY